AKRSEIENNPPPIFADSLRETNLSHATPGRPSGRVNKGPIWITLEKGRRNSNDRSSPIFAIAARGNSIDPVPKKRCSGAECRLGRGAQESRHPLELGCGCDGE